jgi:formate dehydrogenase major subunit
MVTSTNTTAGATAGSSRERGSNTNRPRLTTPLVRDGGELRAASWEEAVERAASGLRAVVSRHGPEAVGMFSCSKATNEVNYAAQRFMRAVIGSNNIDSCNRT